MVIIAIITTITIQLIRVYIQYKYETIFLKIFCSHSHQTLNTRNDLLPLALLNLSTISVLSSKQFLDFLLF